MMVRDALGKVELIRGTRSGFVLISCVSKEEKERALRIDKLLTYEVESFDFCSRVPLKVVISGVVLDVEALWFTRSIPGVVGTHRLNHAVDGD